MVDLKYWVAFSRIPSLGPARFRLLERHFGSLEDTWLAGPSELKAAGIDDRTVRAVSSHHPTISPDAEMEKLERAGVMARTWHDPAYPPRLKEIHDPPPVLYLRGDILPQDERSVAVVGTRKATDYGREVAGTLAGDLARSGVTVVSGLARGIDSIAHKAALDAGGRTIAVFGSGLDVVYPAEHVRLAREVEDSGALVSEHALGTRPMSSHFPMRNRIKSGMTLGTLVVEAPDKSGALITVRRALEQDREVFCVPGSIFSPTSAGTNSLIQQGAKLVMNYEDILEELNLTVTVRQIEMPGIADPLSDGELLLLNHLTYEPAHIDDIGRQAQIPINEVSSTLQMMEIKGLVRQVGGMNYTKVREVQAEYGSQVPS